MRLGGESNKSLKNIFIKMKEDRQALKEHGIPNTIGLIFKNLRKLNQFFRFSFVIRLHAAHTFPLRLHNYHH